MGLGPGALAAQCCHPTGRAQAPPHPSGLPARAGPSCLLPSGDGLTPRQGWGPPRGRTGSPWARMAVEQSEPREGPSLVRDHTVPCQGPRWASGARSHRLETAKGRPGPDPCHPAPAHLPRSHPGQQPSCSTAQRSGQGARGVPMPRAPARPHAAHSLYCRRRGEEAVPGCRRAPPPAHPLFLVGETHSAQTLREGERSGDTGRRRWVCAPPPPTPSPGRLSALSGWLPLPEAGSLLGRGRVFCLPPPASPALSGPRSQCPGAQPPAGATLLGAVGAGAGPCRARPPPMAVAVSPVAVGGEALGSFFQARLRPVPSVLPRALGPSPPPWWSRWPLVDGGLLGPALRRPQVGDGLTSTSFH